MANFICIFEQRQSLWCGINLCANVSGVGCQYGYYWQMFTHQSVVCQHVNSLADHDFIRDRHCSSVIVCIICVDILLMKDIKGWTYSLVTVVLFYI